MNTHNTLEQLRKLQLGGMAEAFDATRTGRHMPTWPSLNDWTC